MIVTCASLSPDLWRPVRWCCSQRQDLALDAGGISDENAIRERSECSLLGLSLWEG